MCIFDVNFVPVVFQLCSSCVPAVFQLCSSCVPAVCQLCSSCVPVFAGFFEFCAKSCARSLCGVKVRNKKSFVLHVTISAITKKSSHDDKTTINHISSLKSPFFVIFQHGGSDIGPLDVLGGLLCLFWLIVACKWHFFSLSIHRDILHVIFRHDDKTTINHISSLKSPLFLIFQHGGSDIGTFNALGGLLCLFWLIVACKRHFLVIVDSPRYFACYFSSRFTAIFRMKAIFRTINLFTSSNNDTGQKTMLV